MSESLMIGPWIRRFLLEHMIGERNLARNTQISYRDTLTLLLPFAARRLRKPIDRLEVEHLSPDLVRAFLSYLEQERQCSVASRNQRLAAVHALAHFIGGHSPVHIAWCAQIRAIPFKKTMKNPLPYLDKPELDALLEAPDKKSTQGRRDHAILLFLYNSGARADEAARLTLADLELGRTPSVRLCGKGGKTRHCPLFTDTSEALNSLASGRSPNERLFLNRQKQPMTRYGIYALVKRYARQVAEEVPSLQRKDVSPHVLRHTSAVHLLRAGVDINTIRGWLGHISLDTTNIYAEIDLEMKAKAIAQCEIKDSPGWSRPWQKDHKLMTFLKAL